MRDKGCVNKDSGSVHLHQQFVLATLTLKAQWAPTHLHCMLDMALSLCAACMSAHKSQGTLRGLCRKFCLQRSNCSAAQVHKLHKLHTHPHASTGCWHAHCTFGQRTNAYDTVDAGCHCLSCRQIETADVKGV